jgi:ribonuclease HI
MMRLLARIKDV